MNRREFLHYCIAAMTAGGFSGLSSCSSFEVSLSQEDKALIDGLRIADAHAHPYGLHASVVYDSSTPTIDMMRQVGMVASSFSAIGDRVKYPGFFGTPFENTMDQLEKVKVFEKNKRVILIRKSSDIPSSNRLNNIPGAVMAIEGGDALEGKIKNLNKFYEYGVRMITIMHAHNNKLGYHQLSQTDGPLTPFGIQVVERIYELGMIVDVAHAKTQTLKGIAEVTAAPLVDSHTNPMAYGYNHPKPTLLRYWSEMELVVKTGGIICTWPVAYSNKYRYPRTTLKDWADEIVEMKKRIGIEHVGLGTDGGGNLRRKVKGWQSILSLPKLIRAMRGAGLSQDDIAAYTGGNFLRVLNQCLS
jgi:membrane dipeptidase